MGLLFLFMFGFVTIMTLTSWAAAILLASVFPIFNFKDEFVEFWIRTRGSPPSRRRLILNAYGAANYFFMAEKCHDLNVPNGIRIVPNANFFLSFMLGFASILVAVLFWVAVFFTYVLVRVYI
ncbi:hypothetical protein LCM27_16535 [Ruegeria marisrubri]|uniref:hypothetical protein n=1 Tax=Ruegeria marisrubri TaxID=1685379 RepID=UPI001CD5C1D8|nr:hypothetical protein [Ruegeria marisrubri]MCA0908008.1 hypothetical protein [Ruegeria marisrubri]